MPLFGSKSSSTHEPAVVESKASQKSTSLFSRRSDSTDASHVQSPSSTTSSSTHHTGLFGLGRSVKDPSIVAAREKIKLAEEAEDEAERALIAARHAVVEAKEHARKLELEAEEDARRAKAKQKEAKDVSKHAGGLGRKYA